MEETIKRFLNNVIPDLISSVYNMPFIKFIFSDEALDEMSKYNDQTVNYLREVKSNYISGNTNNEDIYIEVQDYKEFFSLLTDIVYNYGKREHKSLLDRYNFMRSIWLRMSPSDINNVNRFLKTQLAFLKNDDILPYYPKDFKEYEDITVCYENKANEDWFETNNNITFSFIRSIMADDVIPIEYRYDLPAIHYSLIKENNECVCYIYGMQNISNSKDKIIKDRIQPLRKKLRNKYVSADFVLALKLFIDLLDSNGIYTIKVPLLQVFNYPYHVSLSDNIQRAYSSYENKDELEQKYEEGCRDDMVLDYIHDKKMYEKFVDKEDQISKNKTERLISIFQVLDELFGDIEILNEPFIQGDYLIIRINKKQEKGNEKTLTI